MVDHNIENTTYRDTYVERDRPVAASGNAGTIVGVLAGLVVFALVLVWFFSDGAPQTTTVPADGGSVIIQEDAAPAASDTTVNQTAPADDATAPAAAPADDAAEEAPAPVNAGPADDNN